MSNLTLLTRPIAAGETAHSQALAAMERGDMPAALAAARRATQDDPEQPDAWWALSMAATHMWLLDEAEAALAAGAKLLPRMSQKRADFLSRRARILLAIGRNTLGIQVVRDVLTIEDLSGPVLGLLGSILLHANLPDQAVKVLQRAVATDAQPGDAWFNLARAREATGDIYGAEAAYESSIAAAQHTGAHLGLARLRRWTKDKNHIDRLLSLPMKGAGDMSRIANALFKEYDDLDMRDEAWAWLEKSHKAALNEMLPSIDGTWGDNPQSKPIRVADLPSEREHAIVEAWKRYLPASRFANVPVRRRPATYDGPRRIFIVGLPRSGTTLVERILTAHSQVQSLGEPQFFSVAVKRLSGIKAGGLLSPDIIASAVQQDPSLFADSYDHETAYLSDGSAFTIDKLPQNYDYVGLIRLAFPDAIIIHTRREPMDSLFGAHKVLMGPAFPWLYRQDDLAGHYASYMTLMNHWRTCVHDMIDISLEALIGDPDGEIRRLLNACGLPFESACLRPHETVGAVMTSSSTQVRSPINAQGVGAWRRYEQQLTPLREALYRSGYIDTDGHAVPLFRAGNPG